MQMLFQERCCTRAFDVSICSDFSCFGQPPALEDFCPMRERGGVTAAGSGAGAGAFIAYAVSYTHLTLPTNREV